MKYFSKSNIMLPRRMGDSDKPGDVFFEGI